MDHKQRFSRRGFLNRTVLSAAAAGRFSYVIPRSALDGLGPGANGRIIIGVIGVGGRGNLLVDQLPTVLNNTWFTNYAANSHGLMEFRYDLLWRENGSGRERSGGFTGRRSGHLDQPRCAREAFRDKDLFHPQ